METAHPVSGNGRAVHAGLLVSAISDGVSWKAVSAHISIDRDAVTAFCRRHHIKRLALFGSVLRDDFRPDSDVDVLVEFEPGHVPGLDFVTIEREFSGLLQGRRVDMVTPKFLNPRIRDQVLTSAEPLYVVA
jgi:predicted nucleotidyltransferase